MDLECFCSVGHESQQGCRTYTPHGNSPIMQRYEVPPYRREDRLVSKKPRRRGTLLAIRLRHVSSLTILPKMVPLPCATLCLVRQVSPILEDLKEVTTSLPTAGQTTLCLRARTIVVGKLSSPRRVVPEGINKVHSMSGTVSNAATIIWGPSDPLNSGNL